MGPHFCSLSLNMQDCVRPFIADTTWDERQSSHHELNCTSACWLDLAVELLLKFEHWAATLPPGSSWIVGAYWSLGGWQTFYWTWTLELFFWQLHYVTHFFNWCRECLTAYVVFSLRILEQAAGHLRWQVVYPLCGFGVRTSLEAKLPSLGKYSLETLP